MKRIACLFLNFLVVAVLLVPFYAKCEELTESIERGRTLHLKILENFKKIDVFYKEPYLWGELTNKPLCCISVPTSEWEALDEAKKELLTRYAQSFINKIKAEPFKYAKVNPNAPMASAISRNVAAMSENSWGIMVGSISQDGKDINADRIARSGK